MKMRNYFFAAAAIVLAASCVKENPAQDNGQVAVNYVPMEFTSAVETKTELSDGKVKWLAGDQISIFDNSASAETHNNLFETTGDGSFSGTVPEDATGFYALYPYRAASTLTDGVISAFLSPEQKAVVGSFADDLAVMVAKADGGSLAFKNVCSHIKFTLADDLTDVKSITLMGNKAEILAGAFSINWNEGNPSIVYPLTTGETPVPDKTGAEAYVTLRNEDGSALTPGDYYFTVLPVTFSEGFTVILSKTDETQVAKKTEAANDKIASRNKVLVMKPLAASDYADHMNYFVKYNDGFNLTFGGVTINNETHPGGILATSEMTITKDGVYFIPSAADVKVSYNETSGLVLIGADASTRSSVVTTKTLQPATNENGILLFENLILSTTVTNDIISQKKANANPGTAFGYIVFDNCIIKSIPRHLIYILNAQTSINTINISDCDYSTTAAASNVISFGSSMESKIEKLNVENSIFYYSGESAMTDFKILQGPAATVTDINVVNSTFDRTVIPNAGMVVAGTSTSCYILNNVFNETVLSNKNSTIVSLKVKQPTAGQVIQNYYYSSSTFTLNIPSEIRGGLEKAGTPVRLSVSPLSSSWNPSNGQYGQYSIIPESGDAPTVFVGAQRPDMTGTADAASYRFPAVDLGTF